MYALLAVPVGVFVAVRLAAVAADQSARRLTLVLAAPVTRLRLLAAETAAAIGGAFVLVTVAGLAMWVGAATVDAGLGVGEALAGAWNVLAVVVLCLGAAVLALAWMPRAVATIGVLPAAGGFLWHVVADSVGAPAWLAASTPFRIWPPCRPRHPTGPQPWSWPAWQRPGSSRARSDTAAATCTPERPRHCLGPAPTVAVTRGVAGVGHPGRRRASGQVVFSGRRRRGPGRCPARARSRAGTRRACRAP
ncbi:hypothetical protein [Micromonospora echinofusca]|uniref:hypothetical protein n=1 Tax=Micromonospora echinofusca TaxID=47858 RepID=UPI0033F4E15A